MPHLTAKYGRLHFQHLAIFVIFLSAFLFSEANKITSFFPSSDSPTIQKTTSRLAACLKQNKITKKIASATAIKIKRESAAEALIPAFNLAFRPQIIAFHTPDLLCFSITQKGKVPPYAARAPGISFLIRFFSITSQPNAP